MIATNFLSTVNFPNSYLRMIVLQSFCRLFTNKIDLKLKSFPYLQSLVFESLESRAIGEIYQISS